MIVTCDKCKAKYKVDDKLAGKKVRCANCGNVWRFELDSFTVTDFDDENAQTGNGISSDSAVNNTGDAPVSQTAVPDPAPADGAPKSQADVDAMFDTPPAPVDDAPKSQADVDAMFDTPPAPADDAPKSQADVDAMFDTPPAPADDAPKSQADVDAMFDSFVKQAETEQLQAEAAADNGGEMPVPSEEDDKKEEAPPSIVDEITSGKSGDFAFVPPPDSNKPKPAFGMSLLKFIAVTVATVIICLTLSLWFLRFQLTREFPEMVGIYETVGIDVLPAGTGLEFKEIVYEKTLEEDTEYLWIKGKIVNISDKTRKIPSVMLVLYDGNRKMLDAAVYSELYGKKLAPGKDEPFTIWTANPSKSTAEAEITFTREKSKK